jgi:hypothetical protein
VNSLESEPRVNVSFVLISIFCLIAFGFVALKVYRLKAPTANPFYAEPIGSWMVLPLIGLFISPFVLIYTIFSNGYFNDTLLTSIKATPTGSFISWEVMYIFELCGNLFLLSLGILCLVAFLKRRDITPRLMVVLFSFRVIIIGLDELMVSSFDAPILENALADKKELWRVIIGFVIWVPYFLSSNRVKNTFVVPYGGLQVAEDSPAGSQPVLENVSETSLAPPAETGTEDAAGQVKPPVDQNETDKAIPGV